MKNEQAECEQKTSCRARDRDCECTRIMHEKTIKRLRGVVEGALRRVNEPHTLNVKAKYLTRASALSAAHARKRIAQYETNARNTNT